MRTITKVSTILVAILLVPNLVRAEVLRVTVDGVSLRSQPTTSSAAVGTVTQGMLLEVIGRQGYWNQVRVRSTGEIGYIHSAFVEVEPEQPPARARTNRSPSPPPPPPQPSFQRASQPRQTETGYSDVGSFGIGGYIWDGASSVAFSPIVDISPQGSLLGTFDTTAIGNIRIYVITGNFLYRFPIRGQSSPVTFEPFVGGGAAFGALGDVKTKGFTVLGGTFLKFESFPHVKFSGGMMHIETWGDHVLGAFSVGGSTLMVGAHFFF